MTLLEGDQVLLLGDGWIHRRGGEWILLLVVVDPLSGGDLHLLSEDDHHPLLQGGIIDHLHVLLLEGVVAVLFVGALPSQLGDVPLLEDYVVLSEDHLLVAGVAVLLFAGLFVQGHAQSRHAGADFLQDVGDLHHLPLHRALGRESDGFPEVVVQEGL